MVNHSDHVVNGEQKVTDSAKTQVMTLTMVHCFVLNGQRVDDG